MTIGHPSNLDHRPQSASHGLGIPTLEEAISTRQIETPSELVEKSVIPQTQAVVRPCFWIALKRRRCTGQSIAMMNRQR
jgi:hypothetical protein